MTRAEFKEKINCYLDDIRQTRGDAFVEAFFDKLADRTLFRHSSRRSELLSQYI